MNESISSYPAVREASVQPVAEGDLRDLDYLYAQWLAEHWPEKTRAHNDNPEVDLRYPYEGSGGLWFAHDADGDRPIGCASVALPSGDHRAVDAWLYVTPAERGDGVGKRLLQRVARFLDRAAATAVRVRTTSRCPAAEELAARLQGRRVYQRRIHEALLSEQDLAVLRSRNRRLQELPLTVEVHEGPLPEADLNQLAKLRSMVYGTYGLELTDAQMRDSLVEFESIMERQWLRRLAVFGRATLTGEVVAIGEAIWDPRAPGLLGDYYEAVEPTWRGNRLGAALFARLLLEVRERLPSVRVARLGMHEDARPLHDRTAEIGFEYRHRETRWRITAESLREFVD